MNASSARLAFIGHGSPVNALLDNAFTRALRSWGAALPKPEAVLVISAHWMSNRTLVSCRPDPKQLYDFYGFPDELYHVPYSCPGHPAWAKKITGLLKNFSCECNEDWGIDHGAWSILTHLAPAADLPVVQISLDMTQSPEVHFRIGEALRPLRRKKLWILGSGNLVHNLRLMRPEENAPVPEWARTMDQTLDRLLRRDDPRPLIQYPEEGAHAAHGIPTLDHYLPMLVILGLREKNDSVKCLHEGFQNGTVSMRSFELSAGTSPAPAVSA